MRRPSDSKRVRFESSCCPQVLFRKRRFYSKHLFLGALNPTSIYTQTYDLIEKRNDIRDHIMRRPAGWPNMPTRALPGRARANHVVVLVHFIVKFVVFVVVNFVVYYSKLWWALPSTTTRLLFSLH